MSLKARVGVFQPFLKSFSKSTTNYNGRILGSNSVITGRGQSLIFNHQSIRCLSTVNPAEGEGKTDPPVTGGGGNEATEDFYDVIIAGGGLVGTALAVSLGTSGRLSNKRILLLESAPKFWTKPPEAGKDQNGVNYSNRVVALSPGSKALLTKMGAWENVWRHQTVKSLQVWDALSDAAISFDYPGQSEPVSHIVENPVLAHAICQALQRTQNVQIQFGSKVSSCSIPSAEANEKEKARVVLENGTVLKTDLLVGADGFNSKVRGSISSPAIAFNYDRIAVVATLKLDEAHNNYTAWQRFLPTGGPIALLPLAPNYSSLVWSTTPSHAKELQEMDPEDFVDAINSAYWKEYGRSQLVKRSDDLLEALSIRKGPRVFPPSVTGVIDGSRASFPLGFGHSAYYASRRAVVIGDAAHRVHPLAGQGLNLGLGDVEVLEQVLSEAVGIGGDIGSFQILREYESRRQRHNIAIQSGIDLLHRLYSSELPPIVALRSLGLSFVNSSDLIKKYIMNHAAV